MRDTKRVFGQFTFYDRTGIQRFLEKQAEKGWLLQKIGSFFWIFQRTEPRKVHFTVTYFPKASIFDPEPSESQRMFWDFCEHAGWTLAASTAQMQIFYNEMENPLPIETDPELELKNIHASAKKAYLPGYFILLLSVGLQAFTQLSSFALDPLGFLSRNISLFNILSTLILLAMCLLEVLGYFHWYRKAKRAALEEGKFVRTQGFRTVELGLLVILFAALVGLLYTMNPLLSVSMVIMIAGVLGVILAVTLLREWMKRKRFTARANMALSMTLCVVLTLLVVGGVTFSMVKGILAGGWEDGREPVDTYEAYGMVWDVYDDTLPLYVEDLEPVDYDGYSCEWNGEASLLLGLYKGRQDARLHDDSSAPEIQYSILLIKAPFLYDLCREEMLGKYEEWISEDIYGNVSHDEYRSVDAAGWGANAVYRHYSRDYAYNTYLLCFDRCITEITLDWEPTMEQKQVIGQKLNIY